MSARTKMVSLRLSPKARGAIKSVSKIKGWTKTRTVETAVKNLEITIHQAPEGRTN
jgi:hypothetical protein